MENFRCWLAVCTTLLIAVSMPRVLSSTEFAEDSLRIGASERRFIVHDFSSGEQAPLVIVLHGGGGNGRNAVEQTGFDRVAEREGLIAVYPHGSGRLRRDSLLTWNAGHCCSYAMSESVDDVAFISALIDELVATRSVDPERVFVTGLSNGGMMAHRLGQELAGKITAIAPVIASLFGDEPEIDVSLPVLIINGADDTRVRPEGGPLPSAERLGQRAADAPTLPITSQLEYWANANACSRREFSATEDWSLTIAADCRGDTEVRHMVINGSGHAWPGGTPPRLLADTPTQAVDINEVIWEFFSRY